MNSFTLYAAAIASALFIWGVICWDADHPVERPATCVTCQAASP